MENKKPVSRLTGAVPVEDEQKILLHGEYDGIQELDNALPPWWLWLFAITLVFGYSYIFYYHTLGMGDLSAKEYEKAMIQADAEVKAYLATQPTTDENNVTALTEPDRIQNGKMIFEKNCVSCHGAEGGGGVGPNLTDNQWIHGCGIKNVFALVKNGSPTKGMIAWKDQLSPTDIQEVSSYILTLKGTTPSNPKAPEGEVCNN